MNHVEFSHVILTSCDLFLKIFDFNAHRESQKERFAKEIRFLIFLNAQKIYAIVLHN